MATDIPRTIPNDYHHYSPLDSSRKEIRLLHLRLCDAPDGELEAILVRTFLGQHPPYQALSYCWGNLGDTEQITLMLKESISVSSSTLEAGAELQTISDNRHTIVVKPFNITSNLKAALHSLRHTNTSCFLWADMLCINQGDVMERSSQVSFMKDIYTSASSVLVWLGNDPRMELAVCHDNNAELLLFSRALQRGSSQPWSIQNIMKRFTDNFPESYDSPNMRIFVRNGESSTSFYHTLGQNREKIMRLCRQDPPNDQQDGLIDTLGVLTRVFLLWVHYSFTVDLAQNIRNGQVLEHKEALEAYLEHAMSPQSDVWQLSQLALAEHNAMTPSGFCESIQQRIAEVGSHPWFSRAWVVQEVANNTNVVVRVGDKETSWDAITCLNHVRLQLAGIRSYWLRLDKYPNQIFDHPTATIPGIWNVLNKFQRETTGLPILRLLPYLGTLTATDPRDIVFATYHLATDILAESFRPDYTKSIEETFALFTKWIIDKTVSLSILSFSCHGGASGPMSTLGTWVPDYTQLNVTTAYFSRGFQERSPTEPRSANPLRRLCSMPQILSLEGTQISTIEEVVGIEYLREYLHLFDKDADWFDIPIPLIWVCVRHVHQVCFYSKPKKVQYLEDTQLPKLTLRAFMRVLGRSDDEETLQHLYAPLWKDFDPDLTTLKYSWSESEDMKRWMRNCSFASGIAKMLLSGYLGNAALFFSEDGRLGLCPKAAQGGDSIVAFNGGVAPFILRPTQSGSDTNLVSMLRKPDTYQMIGECHLDGVGPVKDTWIDSRDWQDKLHEDPLESAPWLDSVDRARLDKLYKDPLDLLRWMHAIMPIPCRGKF
jgi:hypothetical protein